MLYDTLALVGIFILGVIFERKGLIARIGV